MACGQCQNSIGKSGSLPHSESGAVITPDTREAQRLEHNIGMREAMVRLAVGDHLLVGCDPKLLEHLAQYINLA